ARLTRTVRRVEREGARCQFGDRNAAVGTRHAPREQPIAPVERVDDDDVVGKLQRELDRLGEPPLDAALDDEAVDENVDGMIAPLVELDVVLERNELPIDACAREALLA